MNREIPSFNAIRFFEAAARHLSFTKAGEELFVTQGAVSKQIKQLEEQLGCQLFARNGPNLQLTSHGLGFQKTVSAAIDTIKQGVSELRRQSANTLRASVLPSFATNWLIPRLHELDRLEPVLSLELLPSYEKVDFSLKTDIDIAIRLGSGDWPGLYALQLTEDNMFPVCSPVIAEGINDVDDLVDATLLVEVRPYDEWSKWFASLGKPYRAKNKKLYEDTNTQISAAQEGQGICLAREEMIQKQLASGELVRLFNFDYVSELHYFFVCPEKRLQDPLISAFHQWLVKTTGIKSP